MTPRLPGRHHGRVVEALRSRLGGLTLVDEARLGRRLAGLRKIRDPLARERSLAAIERAVEVGEAAVARRRAAVPPITYPEHLPVSERRAEIAAAIGAHQVVVLAGETGSGKTTQLPKICLELGRGVRGRIGHTQPRRIAARSVAERLAEELDRPLGETVGYQVRFTDQVGPDTLVKIMTDGILLAEIQRDRDLRSYDTIILDEAHERSLTIDFLLGYLTRLLPRRPELKLIITSATIELDRFATHFGGAPVIEVSGRTYPVEVRYRPLELDAPGTGDPAGGRDAPARRPVERDQVQAICDAVEELRLEGPGDILVFLSGEREIRDAADAIDGLIIDRGLRDIETLPLYGRLSTAEQHRVFSPHPGGRVVLATNVAETSLTVPGIRYVVDAGTARISRYSNRTKVQRLPIEPISQASAKQRAGRCGRLADGICIRLYSQVDHDSRPAFTEPEIQRTSLASVILQMAALGLGAVERFPFIDPPDARQVRDGVALLGELGALEPAAPDDLAGRGPRLTDLGRRIAGLPLDPRLARMVIAADANGCVREVIVIAAALSIQDPRERPVEHRAAADASHARFAHEHSDFLGVLNLWTYLREQQKALSSSAFRRMCRAEFLHYLRIREWQDVVAQLRQATSALGISVTSAPMAHDAIHRSVLTGLLSQVGLRDRLRRDYLGARGVRFAINPGSVLFGKSPDWVMAAELVETTRLWARVCARIEPEWIEASAEPLLYRSYSEPRWSARRGSAIAQEKVHLYGIPVVASRTVAYGQIDPVLSRELFIRHALVDGEWQTRHQFFHDNRALLADAEELEHRARRRDIVVDDETLVGFYDHRVPATVVSAGHFDSWWKHARHETPDLLTFTRELVVAEDTVNDEDYPAVWRSGDLDLPLTYQFEPGADADGITVHVPVSVLGQVTPTGFGHQVPGLRLEMVIALIRSLPKTIRKNFVPVPDVARSVVEHLDLSSPDPLVDLLAWELHRVTGIAIPRDAWDLDRVPAHLRPTYRVEDAAGQRLAEGKDLAALQAELSVEVRRVVARVGAGLERDDVRSWDFGPLPKVVDGAVDGHAVRGYPALVDEGGTVALRVLPSAAEQARAMRAGTRRLLMPEAPSASRLVANYLDNQAKLALGRNPHGGVPALLADVTAATVDAVVDDAGGPAWDPAGFAVLRTAVRQRAADELVPIVRRVAKVLALAHEVEVAVRGLGSPALASPVGDVRRQLAALVRAGFVAATGRGGLADLERYLRAIVHRVQILPTDPARDLAAVERVNAVQAEVDQTVRLLPAALAAGPDVEKIHQMVQELRVSLFAQQIGTAYAISEQRIWRALDRLVDQPG